MLERVIHDEVTDLLVTWLQEAQCGETQERVPLEMIARVVSWAIFGPAVQWSQEAITIPSEAMANTILLVVMDGIAHLEPQALPG